METHFDQKMKSMKLENDTKINYTVYNSGIVMVNGDKIIEKMSYLSHAKSSS